MVEGPTAKAYAFRICKEFEGELVNDVYVKSLKRVFVPIEALIGKKFLKADSIGKNILLFFNSLAIRVHLMMFGAIHIYRLDEGLLKPFRLIRLLLDGKMKRLVVYNAPIIEVDESDRLLDRLKAQLGPDPLSNDWDRRKAIENLLKLKNEKIGVVLLNQSVIAGVGNILRNEILFRAGVNPEREIQSLTGDEIERILEICESISKEFLDLKLEGRGIKPLLFVYNQFNKNCKICGGRLKFYIQKPIARKTFVCINCQK